MFELIHVTNLISLAPDAPHAPLAVRNNCDSFPLLFIDWSEWTDYELRKVRLRFCNGTRKVQIFSTFQRICKGESFAQSISIRLYIHGRSCDEIQVTFCLIDVKGTKLEIGCVLFHSTVYFWSGFKTDSKLSFTY